MFGRTQVVASYKGKVTKEIIEAYQIKKEVDQYVSVLSFVLLQAISVLPTHLVAEYNSSGN